MRLLPIALGLPGTIRFPTAIAHHRSPPGRVIEVSYLDNVTLNEWSAGHSETVLLYVPGGGSLILNDGGEELDGAILRVAFGKGPTSQRLFGGCSHGTLPREAPGREPR